MKTFLFLIILTTFPQLSFASFENVDPIYSIEFLQVDSLSTEPICPINALCKRSGTIVHLGYEIGCHQKLKSFDYKVVSDGKTTELIVSAIATSKAIPGQAVCLAFKFETKKLYLYEVYGDVVVTNLGTN